ncbi:MAG: 1-deoxy-D-xylulose-5-phosphate reductoisomerase [Endomicrobium sp.]|jgi:1-deoxy-D-xylulose-5-phosphate reductoisomerase|nr:1-deoxy-D-xylulose-5-phosphate reductoisomerase [Endomicrobium sp.]
MKKIVVLGSSGSIGMKTLDIAYNMSSKICVKGLAVNSNIETLKLQIKKFKPLSVSINDFAKSKKLKKWCISNGIKVNIYSGSSGLDKLVRIQDIDTVVVAIVGTAALRPTVTAIKSNKNIAIANKEIIVMAGDYIMKIANKNKTLVFPIDSEHSAIFQCCIGEKKSQINRIILTASGGPFYNSDKKFSEITVKEALNHPTWQMGKKTTIDSATLMNKGLEIIEASVLFGVSVEKIEIVIHPQSVLHSMIEYVDGSIIAQLSNPDMRLPIQYALTYPNRLKSNIDQLNLDQIGKLEFFKPNFDKFPCLNLSYCAARKGFTMPSVMNAANEIAVESFLNNEIKFIDIAKIISNTMHAHNIISKKSSLNDFIEADLWARNYAKKLINTI